MVYTRVLIEVSASYNAKSISQPYQHRLSVEFSDSHKYNTLYSSEWATIIPASLQKCMSSKEIKKEKNALVLAN